jgi:hypothetical protein
MGWAHWSSEFTSLLNKLGFPNTWRTSLDLNDVLHMVRRGCRAVSVPRAAQVLSASLWHAPGYVTGRPDPGR